MQYKKIVKLLGIATATSLMITGCNTPSSIFGFNSEEPISCLYGPAPEYDWNEETEDVSVDVEESKNLEISNSTIKNIENKQNINFEKELEAKESVLINKKNDDNVKKESVQNSDNAVSSDIEKVDSVLEEVEEPSNTSDVSSEQPQTILPVKSKTIKENSLLYGPAPVIDEEKDTDVKPVLDGKIAEEPIILLYGPAIDDPEPPQPEEVYPLLYGPAPDIIEPPIYSETINEHPLLYGPMVIEGPPVTQDPEPEISDKVENPIDVVYGPASWYEE